MKFAIILLFMALFCAFGDEKEEIKSLGDVLATFPHNLIKAQQLDNNEGGFAKLWEKDQIGKKIAVKIRWDGGHKGGYCSAKIGKYTFPVHVLFEYHGQMPNKPSNKLSLRTTRCRKGLGTHYKVTRTGKELKLTGTLVSVSKKPRICPGCKKPELITVKIKAESIE